MGRRRNRKKRIAQGIELGIWEEYFRVIRKSRLKDGKRREKG